MEPIVLPKSSNLLKLPEQLYGTIKRVGILNDEPILYGDANLLKPGLLYYIDAIKQVYRYIAAKKLRAEFLHPTIPNQGTNFGASDIVVNPGGDELSIATEVVYIFDSIKPVSSDSLSVPEDERGHIRNAGYLFNEIIYSGDPNLVKNGNLFYHDTLPYISIVSNVDGVINLSTRELNEEGEITTVVTEYVVSPKKEQHDYSKDYLTFEALEDCVFTFSTSLGSTYITSISYSIDNGQTWILINDYPGTTPTISAGGKVMWKGIAKLFYQHSSNLASRFFSTGNYNISGNIMSLFYSDDFMGQTIFPSDTEHNIGPLFADSEKIVSAQNLILPVTKLKGYCYYKMFYHCSLLTSAPALPATTLANYCYSNMFEGCTSLTTAPELPAITLYTKCYLYMFYDCSSLNYIKAMCTKRTSPLGTISSDLSNWVFGVALTGTFVKNSEATWTVTGVSGVPTGWAIETADPESSDEITI